MPSDPARYGQDIARADVVAIMDALGIAKAHVVGHSMGAYTALHIGIRHAERCISVTAAGCGWGSVADPASARGHAQSLAAENAKLFTDNDIKTAAAIYADAPARRTHKYKDPRGFAEFARMLSEHSALGHALTMSMLQAKRPTLWDLEADLKRFSVPLLVIVGDEDDTCIEGSVFLKPRCRPRACWCVPRSGHNITSEEPAIMNAALADFFAAAEGGPLAVAQAAGMIGSSRTIGAFDMTSRPLLCIATTCVALAFCGTPALAQGTIKIGELNSYKSQPAFLEPYKRGWEMAVEEINAKGGVLGKKLEVISRDDGGNPGDAVRVAERARHPRGRRTSSPARSSPISGSR